MSTHWAAAALVVALSTTATAQVAILQIQVIEGEGEVHAPGSRSARPLTVGITDESGQPVAGAAVSFHLPEEGPSGLCANGLRTDVSVTDAQGRASLRGLRWNREPGRLQIRIIASKEQVRAGIVSFHYIAERGSGAASARGASRVSHRGRWIAVLALAGGGAAAGVLASRGSGGAAPGGAGAITIPPTSVGTPSIIVGKP